MMNHRHTDGTLQSMFSIRQGSGLVALSLLVTVAVAGCGSSGGSDTSAPAVCSDMSSLQQSVQSLKDVQLGAGALSTLQADIGTIRQQFGTLKQDAQSQYATETGQLSAALDQLSADAAAAKDAPAAGTIAAVATSVKNVGDATTSLGSAVKNTC
jgi:hypothetical protein